jgi:hypothetical protein
MAIFTASSACSSRRTPLVRPGRPRRQTKDVLWRQIVASVRVKVEEGSTLSEAMAEHPQAFDAVAAA